MGGEMSRGRPDARRRANLLYKPADLIAHMIGAVLASLIFKKVWSIVEHGQAAAPAYR